MPNLLTNYTYPTYAAILVRAGASAARELELQLGWQTNRDAPFEGGIVTFARSAKHGAGRLTRTAGGVGASCELLSSRSKRRQDTLADAALVISRNPLVNARRPAPKRGGGEARRTNVATALRHGPAKLTDCGLTL
jgi:hypothetical protein